MRFAWVLILPVWIGAIPRAMGAEWWGYQGGPNPQKPEWRLVEESSEGLVVEVSIYGFYYERVGTQEGEFYRLTLTPWWGSSRSPVGAPELPLLTKMIALPDGVEGKLRGKEIEWVDAGIWRIYPRQAPQKDGGQISPPFSYDPEAYRSVSPMPWDEDFLTRPQGLMGTAISTLSLTPFRYHPLTGRLEMARRVRVRIGFEPGGIIPVKPHRYSPLRDRLLSSLLLNPPLLNRNIPARDENEPVRMLFVLKEEAQESVEPLVEFHHRSGLRSQVWIVEGDEDPQEIKDHIRELYQQGLEYVLLVGDAYLNDYDIPMYHWDQVDPGRRLPPGEQTDAYSDSWYVCLDPPQNGYDDHIPDLAIGRLVYDSPNQMEQLQIQVAKTLGYMSGEFVREDAQWVQRAILVAHREFRNGVYTYVPCKQAIRDFDYQGPTPSFIAAFGNVNGVRNRTIYNAVNDVGVGILNYRGHGLETTWDVWNNAGELWSVGNVRNLTNEVKPFIAVSSACLNNNIARWAGNCMGEVFQKHTGGSLAFHGSTESSFTEGNTFFDIRLFQAFFDDQIYPIGYASNVAVTAMVQEFDAQGNNGWPVIGRFNARCYIWLGDPAVEYRLGEQREVQLEYPEIVPIGAREIAMRIVGEGDLQNYRVTLRGEDGEVYLTALSDANGEARLRSDEGLPGPQHLYLSAYHRNSFLVEDTILVADALGVIEGRVFARSDSQPIEGATVTLSRFNVRTNTDQGGQFLMVGIPSSRYTLTASAPGWISEIREVEVVEEETTRVEFYLTYALLDLSPRQVTVELDRDSTTNRSVELRNLGDGALVWRGQFVFQPGEDSVRRVAEFPASLEVNDSKLLGVVFVGDHFYLSGGNENADPNYIYKLDRQGRLVGRWEQPREAAGVGIRQLTWDGEFLYGSSGSTIFKMTLEGEVVERFSGPYDPNNALTSDLEGHFWVGNDRMPLRMINGRGDILRSVEHNLPVRALAWYPEAQDGFSLLIFVQPPQGIHLYRMNPTTGQYRFEADLTQEPNETPSYGLHLTTEWDGEFWSLVGIVGQERVKRIVIWRYAPSTPWVSFEPSSGSLQPGERGSIRFSFNAHGLVSGREYLRILRIENNGRNPSVEIPLTLRINPVSAGEDRYSEGILPSNLALMGVFPQPFNANLQILIRVPSRQSVVFTLYDLSGRQVSSMKFSALPPGQHRLSWSGEGLPSGLYVLKLEGEKGEVLTHKVILMR